MSNPSALRRLPAWRAAWPAARAVVVAGQLVATAFAGPLDVAGGAVGPALQQGCAAARLQPLSPVGVCGPAGCGSWLGALFIDADGAGLRRANRPLPVVVDGPPDLADLPELNWRPLQSFAVRQGRTTWGQCRGIL